ncbi:MAG: HNH endonuclease [Reyranellaceae bacterium]
MKAVFDTKAASGYDDDIVERYHFPNDYLAVAKKAVGDWIVYREPRRGGGSMGYIAVARVTGIDPDPKLPSHSYARVRDFLRFDRIVPFRRSAGLQESKLDYVPSARVGAALRGNSIREISDEDFARISLLGLDQTLSRENAVRLELDPAHADADTAALLAASWEEQERRVEQILVNRKIRDASFRRQVCDAYENTCAVTRLKMINGGGKAEAQAAHIWPVQAGGPDVVQNGIALSATAHWLFDRHLISLTDNYGLLVSHNRVPEQLRSLFQSQLDRIHLPKDESLWPHIPYVQKHRSAYLG